MVKNKELEKNYTKETPLVTSLSDNYSLNKLGSAKDTRHFTISIKGSGLKYKSGDSLYVFPQNDTKLVNELLNLIFLNDSKENEFKRFYNEINITRPSNKFFKLIETKVNLDPVQAQERFNGYTTVAIIKILKQEYPDLIISSNELAENSSRIMPRAYSIASSPKLHPDEIHLCIARVEQNINGQKILGLCSNYLSDRIAVNDKVLRIYLHSNDKFRLPSDHSKSIIMVGPGTGIAPFRAFIQERNYYRDKSENVGKDWLFFGDQHHAFDYIYGEELEKYKLKYGLRISTAFSRDQEQKIYVQDRMKEQADEIFEWLENGAYFYVCGDARKMAKDVDETLQQIIQAHGKDPITYIKQLKEEQRYSRDVY